MSLNLMSLIGVGRVGLGPNMDDVTNFTLFFLKASLRGQAQFLLYVFYKTEVLQSQAPFEM